MGAHTGCGVNFGMSALLFLGMSSASAVALAQQAGGDADKVAVQTGRGLEEIVVMAQRRAENLQEVPIAITALTAGAIEAANITGTQDLVILTPGLNFNSVGGYGQPRIRGIGTTADTPTLENPIATYVDGVYYAHQGGSLMSLNNIKKSRF